jgi:hypothetical protein
MCPTAASTIDTLTPCGGSNVYCEQNSIAPTPALQGYYTVSAGVREGATDHYDLHNTTRTAQVLCSPGWYCSGGIQYPVRCILSH